MKLNISVMRYFDGNFQRLSSSENKAQKAAAAKKHVQPAKMQHGGNGAGRKREWRPMESSSADDDEHNTVAYSSYNGSHNGLQGEPIEKEMKKLRLAHDYDASRSAWSSTNHEQQWTAIAAAEPMEVEGQDAMEGGEANHNYAAKNNLLRECHYLRQLRKFQSERMRERASYFERRNPGVDTQTPYLHEPRY